MMPKRAFPGVSTLVIDFLAGLTIFLALASWLGATNMAGMAAYAHELPWPPEFVTFDAPLPLELMSGPAPRYLPDVFSLGVALAATLALNLWLARHIARTYVAARGRGPSGRRG